MRDTGSKEQQAPDGDAEGISEFKITDTQKKMKRGKKKDIFFFVCVKLVEMVPLSVVRKETRSIGAPSISKLHRV